MIKSIARWSFAVALLAAPGHAIAGLTLSNIDLALNLIYNDPADAGSGGSWEVIAASNGFGINAVGFALDGVDPVVTQVAPSGTVNGSDDAGFALFQVAPQSYGTSVFAAHDAFVIPPGNEVGEFYGFGTITNGSPLFPGTPMGANTVPGSPNISTLNLTTGLPWATGDTFGDPAFDLFAAVASGTFSPGSTPAFVTNTSYPIGSVYTSLGTATMLGGTSLEIDTSINLLPTRDNLGLPGDYDGDGSVNAGDYVVWRDGASPDSSINGFDVWRDNFGAPVAPPVLAAGVVPEPASVVFAIFSAAAVGGRRRRRP